VDGRALSGLRAGDADRADAGRTQGGDRRRGERGPAPSFRTAGFHPLAGGHDMSAAATTVGVVLGDRSYDILIGPGLTARAGEEIAKRLPGVRAAIVSDENVAGHHLVALSESLSGSGIASTAIALPAGEKTKSFEFLQQVVDGVLAARLERGD